MEKGKRIYDEKKSETTIFTRTKCEEKSSIKKNQERIRYFRMFYTFREMNPLQW